MIKEEKYALLIAESTHLIMKTESLLKENKIECRIIPLPGELKASCGLSVKIELEDLNNINRLLENNEINLEKYIVQKNGLKKQYEKI